MLLLGSYMIDILPIFRAKMSMDNDKRPGNGSSYKFARKRHKSDEIGQDLDEDLPFKVKIAHWSSNLILDCIKLIFLLSLLQVCENPRCKEKMPEEKFIGHIGRNKACLAFYGSDRYKEMKDQSTEESKKKSREKNKHKELAKNREYKAKIRQNLDEDMPFKVGQE